MTAVVFLGVATLDTIALVDRYPHADERVVVQALEVAGGGPAATAAVACARLGVPAAIVARVGDDPEGRQIVDGLAAEGLDTTGIEVAGRSGASVVIVDSVRSTRAICNRPSGVPGIGRAALALIAGADWLHVDQLGWQALSSVRDALPASVRISVDGGNPIGASTLAGVALYVPTLSALRATYGDGDPGALLRAARSDGASVVVATDGSRGSYGMGEDDELIHVPAVTRFPIRSTLGAGDVFHGALVAAFVRGMDLAAAMSYANHVAALSCGALDGRSGIPTHQAVLAALDPSQEDR